MKNYFISLWKDTYGMMAPLLNKWDTATGQFVNQLHNNDKIADLVWTVDPPCMRKNTVIIYNYN